MPTAGQTYRTKTPRSGTREVRIAGTLLDHVSAVDWGFAISQVPTATIRVRGATPSNVSFFADVRIDAGFNNINDRQFSGRVAHVDRDGPDTVISCMGNSSALDVPYHKEVKTFTNITDEQAVTDLLDDAGVLLYQVDMPTPLWTIGTVVQPTITFQTFGEAINHVGEVVGAGWYEFPSGVIRVARVDPLPSLTASEQIFAMDLTGISAAYPDGITQTLSVDGTVYPTLPHIRQLRAEQQIRNVKNQAWVKGATIDVVQGDGTTSPVDISGHALATSPWVLNPDGTQAYNDILFTNELIDTVDQADDTALRLVTINNRLVYLATVDVDFDPTISLCQTIQLEDPRYARLTGNWFVVAYQTSMSETDAQTTIQAIGGIEAGGTPNVAPFAFFVYSVVRQVIGTKVYAIVTLNGLLSKDFDGEIVSYSWSDNQGFVTGSTPVLTVRVDPSLVVDPWIITLTVRDDQGETGTESLTVNIASGAPDVSIPAVFVAFDNKFSATPDGGQTWYDQAGPGGDSVQAVGALARGNPAAGSAVYGTLLGALYKTTDYCQTAPSLVLAAVGSPFVHILADRNNLTHIYALTRDGRVYRSLTNGDSGTWELYETLRTKLALPALVANRIALPLGGGGPTGGVWVYAGSGTGQPVIAVDAARNHDWRLAAIGGELATDLAANAAAADLIVFEAASREQNELAIILNSATFPTSVYYTSDIHGDGTKWKRCTGLPAKTRGRYIGPDLEFGKFIFAYDDTAWYLGDVTNEVMAATLAAGTLQAGDAPNHGIFEGDYIGSVAGVYLSAAEGSVDGTVWKTFDRAGTWAKFRPAAGFATVSAGMNAKQLSIGDAANVTLDSLLAHRSPRNISTSESYPLSIAQLGALWGDVTAPGATTQGDLGWFYHLGGAYYRLNANVWAPSSHNKPSTGQLQRSTDLITWTNVGPAPSTAGGALWGVADMDVGADGTLWLVAMDVNNGGKAPELHNSTNDGVTWNLIKTGTSSGAGLSGEAYIDVCCHPTNKDYVVIIGDDFPGILKIWRSTNATAGATFTHYNTTNGNQSIQHLRQGVVTQSGRLVLITQAGLDDMRYTDTFSGTSIALVSATGLPSSTYTYQIYKNASGSVLFVAGGGALTTTIYRSRDSGTTWEVLDDTSFGNTRTYAQAFNALSMFYDEVRDRLYVGFSGDGGGTTPAGQQIVFVIANAGLGAVPVAPTQIFDISLNLRTLWGNSLTGNIAPQGLTR